MVPYGIKEYIDLGIKIHVRKVDTVFRFRAFFSPSLLRMPVILLSHENAGVWKGQGKTNREPHLYWI